MSLEHCNPPNYFLWESQSLLGMVGGGKAALMDDAKEKVAALEADGVEVHVGSTPESKETYNKLLAEEPEGSVAALFHTGCL